MIHRQRDALVHLHADAAVGSGVLKQQHRRVVVGRDVRPHGGQGNDGGDMRVVQTVVKNALYGLFGKAGEIEDAFGAAGGKRVRKDGGDMGIVDADDLGTNDGDGRLAQTAVLHTRRFFVGEIARAGRNLQNQRTRFGGNVIGVAERLGNGGNGNIGKLRDRFERHDILSLFPVFIPYIFSIHSRTKKCKSI